MVSSYLCTDIVQNIGKLFMMFSGNTSAGLPAMTVTDVFKYFQLEKNLYFQDFL